MRLEDMTTEMRMITIKKRLAKIANNCKIAKNPPKWLQNHLNAEQKAFSNMYKMMK